MQLWTLIELSNYHHGLNLHYDLSNLWNMTTSITILMKDWKNHNNVSLISLNSWLVFNQIYRMLNPVFFSSILLSFFSIISLFRKLFLSKYGHKYRFAWQHEWMSENCVKKFGLKFYYISLKRSQNMLLNIDQGRTDFIHYQILWIKIRLSKGDVTLSILMKVIRIVMAV